jgi:hypothetical protein
MFKMESAQMEDETVMSIGGAQRDLHACGGDGPRKHWLFLRSELDIWVRSKVHSGGHPCS